MQLIIYAIPVEARFSSPDQTSPGAYPGPSRMGTGSFPGVKRPGRGVDQPPPSSAEVKERVDYISTPLSVPSCRLQGEIYLIYHLCCNFVFSPCMLNEYVSRCAKVTDGDHLQICKPTDDMLNKQMQTTEKGQSNFGVEYGLVRPTRLVHEKLLGRGEVVGRVLLLHFKLGYCTLYHVTVRKNYGSVQCQDVKISVRRWSVITFERTYLRMRRFFLFYKERTERRHRNHHYGLGFVRQVAGIIDLQVKRKKTSGRWENILMSELASL